MGGDTHPNCINCHVFSAERRVYIPSSIPKCCTDPGSLNPGEVLSPCPHPGGLLAFLFPSGIKSKIHCRSRTLSLELTVGFLQFSPSEVGFYSLDI